MLGKKVYFIFKFVEVVTDPDRQALKPIRIRIRQNNADRIGSGTTTLLDSTQYRYLQKN
jgi:hypothetical protein